MEPTNAYEEEKLLRRRLRQYVMGGVLGILLMTSTLAVVLQAGGHAAAWLAWGVLVVLTSGALSLAGVRAARLSKRYRQIKWGEE